MRFTIWQPDIGISIYHHFRFTAKNGGGTTSVDVWTFTDNHRRSVNEDEGKNADKHLCTSKL
jgi:hypothetical protein